MALVGWLGPLLLGIDSENDVGRLESCLGFLVSGTVVLSRILKNEGCTQKSVLPQLIVRKRMSESIQCAFIRTDSAIYHKVETNGKIAAFRHFQEEIA